MSNDIQIAENHVKDQSNSLEVGGAPPTDPSAGGVDLTPIYRAELAGRIFRVIAIVAVVVICVAIKVGVRAMLR